MLILRPSARGKGWEVPPHGHLLDAARGGGLADTPRPQGPPHARPPLGREASAVCWAGEAAPGAPGDHMAPRRASTNRPNVRRRAAEATLASSNIWTTPSWATTHRPHRLDGVVANLGVTQESLNPYLCVRHHCIRPPRGPSPGSWLVYVYSSSRCLAT